MKLLGNIVALCLLMLASWSAIGDEVEQRRINISASLFPRIVAVDLDVGEKLIDGSTVNIVFLYNTSPFVAEDAATLMREKSSKVGAHTVAASVMSLEELKTRESDSYTALFLAEKLSETDLGRLIEFAGNRKKLLFSPFSGDVEQGVTVGLSVENRIRPYFNLASLRSAHIRMNEKLLGVSKVYE